MKKILESLLDLIYRKKCYFCGKSKTSLKMCPDCYAKLEFCEHGANRVIDGVDVYCAGFYTKELQKLIRGVKYHKQRELAYYQAKFMYDYLKQIGKLKEEYELVPVPLHKNRIKKRKYNHMELVCEELSKLTGWKCNYSLIERIKDTKPQYKLTRKERLQNLSQAFKVNNSFYNGTKVLLVDDICTTGATFEEMIMSLKTANISNITCFATSTPV
ncbi:MAG: ComF family protein [bacterium]|nr:ComF family protein [bacterium]